MMTEQHGRRTEQKLSRRGPPEPLLGALRAGGDWTTCARCSLSGPVRGALGSSARRHHGVPSRPLRRLASPTTPFYSNGAGAGWTWQMCSRPGARRTRYRALRQLPGLRACVLGQRGQPFGEIDPRTLNLDPEMWHGRCRPHAGHHAYAHERAVAEHGRAAGGGEAHPHPVHGPAKVDRRRRAVPGAKYKAGPSARRRG